MNHISKNQKLNGTFADFAAIASTTNIGNSILIMENSDLGSCETLETTKSISKSKYCESCYYFDLELFHYRKICSPSPSSSFFI